MRQAKKWQTDRQTDRGKKTIYRRIERVKNKNAKLSVEDMFMRWHNSWTTQSTKKERDK